MGGSKKTKERSVFKINILCLDQSTKITGYSLWNFEKKELLEYGIVSSDIKENEPLNRMRIMRERVIELLDKYKPDYVVLEQVQFQQNYRTYSQLSQLQGVLFSVLFEKNIGFCLVEPTKWKKYSNIKGRKRVEQKQDTIQKMKEKYNINDITEDMADSIGIGTWSVNNLKVKE